MARALMALMWRDPTKALPGDLLSDEAYRLLLDESGRYMEA